MSILEISNLTKKYKLGEKNYVSALKGVDIEIEKGDFLAVMGPSGSGKSTFINMITGIDDSTDGTINFNGIDIARMNKDLRADFRKKNIGIVFQDFNLLDSLTVKENIMLPLILDEKEDKFMDNEAEKLLNLFGIEQCRDKYPCEISGGQMQRTAIARAVINNPKIVIADEPTGNLDSKASGDVMNCFKDMNTTFKTTILMVTHDPFAASFCNKIIFIKDGIIENRMVRREAQNVFLDRILKHLSIVGGGKGEIQ